MSDFESRARKAAESVRAQIDQQTLDEQREIRRAKRSQMRTAIPSTVAVLALIAGGLFVIGHNDSSGSKNNSSLQLAASLQPFNACTDTLKYFQSQGVSYYENMLQGGGGKIEPLVTNPGGIRPNSAALPGGNESKTLSDSAPTTTNAPGTAGAPQFSSTNNQVKGVDEPDTIKTDGNIIATVNGGVVYVLTANGGHPQIQSKLSFEGNADNLLLSGNRLVVLSGNNDMGTQEIIATYDISDPAKPTLVGELTVDGSLVDARMVGSQIRVGMSWQADPQLPSPQLDDDGNLTAQAKAALPGELNATTLRDWLPQFTVTNGTGATVSKGQLVACDKLSHPTVFAGLDSVSLFTFDANSMPSPDHAVGVLADGDQMYATAHNTYISSVAYDPNAGQDNDNPPNNTAIHEFTTDSTGISKYVGSGTVDGSLLSSYSMDEYNGVLRVATTTNNELGILHPHQVVGGVVTTLRNSGNQLVQAGKVSGLGSSDNESITAVRFVGDRGYVSTARQTDPFYVIDLSDPQNPKQTGQLKVPGSTSYLEPLSGDLVLAVGQSGTSGGLNSPGGVLSNAPAQIIDPRPVPPLPPIRQVSQLQFSLYDVSDATSPKQVGSLQYGVGQAGAQFDPHAFLYWQPRNLVIAPANVLDANTDNEFTGLLLMQTNGDTLKEIGRLADTENTDNGISVARSIVIDNDVYMLSNDNLQVDSLDTYAQVATVSLP